MSSKILITGAAGFVGSCLTNELVNLGREVHVLLKSHSSTWRLEKMNIFDKLNVHYVDLLDFNKLKEIVNQIKPDIVYHLATRGAYSKQNDSNDIFQTNVVGTWNLLQALGKNFELFVNVGSSSEYGFKYHAMREIDYLNPNSYYSATKSSQTLLCQQVARSENLNVTTLRLFSVYGPYEDPNRLIPSVIKNAYNCKEIKLASPDFSRDFIYIDDVMEAILSVEKNKDACRGEIINIGTGVQTSLKEVVECICDNRYYAVKLKWNSFAGKEWDSDSWVADISKSRHFLKWKPKYDLKSGIGKTIEWWELNNYENLIT